MAEGKRRVEYIPNDWVEEIRPLVEQGRQFKEAAMAKGQMKSNKEVKKPKKSPAEKSAGKGIVDIFAKPAKGKPKK